MVSTRLIAMHTTNNGTHSFAFSGPRLPLLSMYETSSETHSTASDRTNDILEPV